MNSAAEDIKDYLVDQGVGTLKTDLFVGDMPNTPDACVSIVDSPGLSPELRYEWERPGIQILTRASIGGYRSAYTKAKLVYDTLHGTTNETINATIYKLIAAAHSPLYVGKDEKNRPMWSINFNIQRTSA